MAATPPIQIGELLDVPTPGAAIKSAWAQEVTNRIVHRFATSAARDAAWPAATAGNGAMCYLTSTKQLMLCDGTGWMIISEPQQTYTPIWSGIPGVSSNQGFYTRSCGFVDFMIDSVFTGAPSAQPTVTLPVNVTDVRRYQFAVTLRDVSVNTYRGLNETLTNGNAIVMFAPFGSGGTEAAANIGAATPFAWAAGDGIAISGRARMQLRNTP